MNTGQKTDSHVADFPVCASRRLENRRYEAELVQGVDCARDVGVKTARKLMKRFQILLLLGVIALVHPAGAALFESGTLNTAIPDNNLTGISSTIDISSAPFSTVTDVNVRLNISGGYNGDLYVYLTHDGATAILLNRISSTMHV